MDIGVPVQQAPEYSLPIGICKQAVMKLDSFMQDIHEIKEDDDISPENKLMFEQISEMTGNMMAAIINTVSQEMNEESFMAETIDMDSIEDFPNEDQDLMNSDV